MGKVEFSELIDKLVASVGKEGYNGNVLYRTGFSCEGR
jgi:hypothetical protein